MFKKVKRYCDMFLHSASEHARIVRNSAWLLGSEVIAKLILLGAAVILARYLGAQGYGKLQSAISIEIGRASCRERV